MKGFFQKIKDIWSIEELKKKILFTLGLVLIYRIGSFIIIPGVDSSALDSASVNGGGGLGDLLNLFSGGAFSRASIFALG
ncbi:MAG: preprotein translocase subunit SecY, partial [Flavobacteriales bacterium]